MSQEREGGHNLTPVKRLMQLACQFLTLVALHFSILGDDTVCSLIEVLTLVVGDAIHTGVVLLIKNVLTVSKPRACAPAAAPAAAISIYT